MEVNNEAILKDDCEPEASDSKVKLPTLNADFICLETGDGALKFEIWVGFSRLTYD